MDSAVFALIIAAAAGLSTVLGALIVFVRGNSEKLVTAALGFAAGVMISISFIEMFPTAVRAFSSVMGEQLGVLYAVLALIGGVLIAAGLDMLVPHEHDSKGEKNHGNMYRLGAMSMLAIAVHNFPEGIATFMAGLNDAALGVSVALAIALHNIPEGITVAMPVYYATGSRKRAIFYTFVSGVSEPIGALLAYLFLRPYLNDVIMGAAFAVVVGIMLYIALEELLPASRQYGYTRLALFSVLSGVCLMPLTMVIA
ncbi:MAG: zinc transporter ZupT [Clostridiales bacterium]|jgi:ZIP family zinc transporter|nr:zinc transporter ZupT [Clostridiales bacterium]